MASVLEPQFRLKWPSSPAAEEMAAKSLVIELAHMDLLVEQTAAADSRLSRVSQIACLRKTNCSGLCLVTIPAHRKVPLLSN